MEQKRPSCKVALVNLDEDTSGILADAFKQFRIQSVRIATSDYRGLGTDRFDGCVLRLVPGCELILEGLRNSRRDKHAFLYGIAVPGQPMQQISKFGVNILLNDPVTRQAALKIIRSTHLLVLHEFRRYVRVPLITDVQLRSGSSTYECSSLEVSGGGMSLRSTSKLAVGESVESSFTLPGSEKFSCNATICWVKPDREMIGIRFDPSDSRRARVKHWIEGYLEM